MITIEKKIKITLIPFMSKTKKVPNDQLSTDVGPTRHKWEKGKWIRTGIYNERIDTCILCGCQRHIVSFWINGIPHTEVSTYVRSGIHLPAIPAPECWRDKNPK